MGLGLIHGITPVATDMPPATAGSFNCSLLLELMGRNQSVTKLFRAVFRSTAFATYPTPPAKRATESTPDHLARQNAYARYARRRQAR